MFPAEMQNMTDDMLGNGQYKPGYTQAYFQVVLMASRPVATRQVFNSG
jgi:hypothetical protein